ncbi:hypothetical protein [Phormidium tenue]|uniref:hypothetical protein n=1 Tax=Phormidium tenue TaxID=126344 RepID=UPI0015C55691|nr:hypothetical protein [Phormidium tenue]MBD2232527.1 hypothetical protein [Phormidium tenue FACHB-1052]
MASNRRRSDRVRSGSLTSGGFEDSEELTSSPLQRWLGAALKRGDNPFITLTQFFKMQV